METAIIGGGITGCIFLNEIPLSALFEKSGNIGGRISHGNFSNGDIYESGATILKKEASYTKDQEEKQIDIQNYLHQFLPELTIKQIPEYSIFCYPLPTMSSICAGLTHNKNVKLNHTLESIQKDKDYWMLKFTNKQEFLAQKIIITAPLPQALSSLKNSNILNSWENISKEYIDYRPALTSTGIWKGIKRNDLHKIEQLPTNLLFRGQDTEFVSIESKKRNSSNLIITIQYSGAFSSLNLERWTEQGNLPTRISNTISIYYFQKVFEALGIDYLDPKKPDELSVKRWRYGLAETPLLKQSDVLNLDDPKLIPIIELGKKNDIWLLGDWIWGSKIHHSIIGCKFFTGIIHSNST